MQLFLLFCVISSCTLVLQITRHSTELYSESNREQPSSPNKHHEHFTPMADTAMHMSMQMTFEASTAVTLWLKQWHTHSWGSYFVSCIGLVTLCLLHEALSAFRNQFHEDFVGSQKSSQYETFAPQTPSDREAPSPSSKRYATQGHSRTLLCRPHASSCSPETTPGVTCLQEHEPYCSQSSSQLAICAQSKLFLPAHVSSHDL